MDKEKKFIGVVYLRNAFTALTIISLAVFLYQQNIWLLVALIALIFAYIFSKKVEEKIEEQTIAVKKEMEELRKLKIAEMDEREKLIKSE